MRPNLPWRAILVVGQAVADCPWHIDSIQARAKIQDFKVNSARGALW
jgi:hypothetical protein